MYIKIGVVLLALMLFSTSLSAQFGYRSGYVVTLQKDTLYGEIDNRGDMKISKTFYWTVNYDFDFLTRAVILPKQFYTHGFSTGIGIRIR